MEGLSIREAGRGDTARIVGLHQRAFRDFFMTRLGPRFLAEYYRLVLDHPGGILLLATRGEAAVGFVSGFSDPSRFYATMRARRLTLARAALPGLARRPFLLARLLANSRQVRRVAQRETAGDRPECELSSIAVDPAAGGGGVGKSLMLAFRETAAKRGADALYLTTDADDNSRVNSFYRSLGLEVVRQVAGPGGRLMNEYTWYFGEQARGDAGA